MRIKSIVLAAVTAAAVLPAVAAAQTFESIVVRRAGSGMLGLATESIAVNSAPARTRVVVDVVNGSAAARAGVAVGDTIVRINGLAATEQLMFAPLEVGDTVVLRIRRNGTERDVTVVAAERPRQTVNWQPALTDSVQHQMSIILRGVQQNLDTLARRGMVIERFAADSGAIFRFGGDSVRVHSFFGRPPMLPDSVDVILRSMREDVMRSFGDSARMRVYTLPDGRPSRIESFGPTGQWIMADTIRFLNPAEALSGTLATGMRAVAGAELTELNPGLAEYFGVMNGVLVINAREGTPAANAGIRGGDVIVRANNTNITSIADLRRIMAQAGPRAPVEIRVLRHGQPVDVRIGG